MNPQDDDTSTRTGLWVVFTTVTILLISVIIWVLKGADATDGSSSVAATSSTPAAATAAAALASDNGQASNAADQTAATAAAAEGAANGQPTVDEEFIAFEEEAPAQLTGAIYFESASATLPAESQQAIASVVEALKASESRRILLAGYHDPTGNIDFNRELAKRRALGVRDALIAQGIPAERIVLRKPEQTAGTGNNAEARRVELLLLD